MDSYGFSTSFSMTEKDGKVSAKLKAKDTDGVDVKVYKNGTDMESTLSKLYEDAFAKIAKARKQLKQEEEKPEAESLEQINANLQKQIDALRAESNDQKKYIEKLKDENKKLKIKKNCDCDVKNKRRSYEDEDFNTIFDTLLKQYLR